MSRLEPESPPAVRGLLAHSPGDNPLDASTVHPEAYPVVERILAATQQALEGSDG
ncbi:hypothetical protein ACNKHM_14800 [Shigella sonnei]